MTDEYRILVVDDTPTIHKDYRAILSPRKEDPAAGLEEIIFGPGRKRAAKFEPAVFSIDSAYQGKQALDMIEHSMQLKLPYALAFVDVRMPPGWDGIETIYRIWQIYEDLEVVIATAYSDHSLEDIIEKLVRRDRFLILKKPFDPIVVLQMAYSLTEKWKLRQELLAKVSDVRRMLNERSKRLDAVDATTNSTDLVDHLRNTRKTLQDVTADLKELTKKP